jgi:hypothetical protein
MPLLFIVRSVAPLSDLHVKLARGTPEMVRTAEGQQDYFVLGDQALMDRLAAEGARVVPLKDGWYADDKGGGVAVWGGGRFFELRSTMFSVRECIRPDTVVSSEETGSPQETFNIRRAILGGT